MGGMYRFDVFVAYATPDREEATRLYAGLQAWRVAIDFKVVPPGGEWMELLPEAISASRVILVLVSEHGPNAQYLKDEIALICSGEERSRPDRVVVPIYLKEGLKPPYGLRPKQHIEGWRGTDHILTELHRVLPPLPPPPSPTVRTDKNVLLRYRKQLRQTANDLPAVFRPDQDGTIPALSQVRVRVEVSAHHGLDRRLGEKHAKIHLLSDVLSVPEQRHWALLGEPGSGKSTLLHDLVLQVLDNPESPYLPILLRIAELQEGEGLVQAVCRFYGQDNAGLIEATIAEKRALILLDGLDETSGSSGAHAVRRVMADAEGCPVILSSRITDYRAPHADFLSLHIQPLREAEQAELLQNWLKTVKSSRPVEERVAEAQQTLRRRSLQKMAQNPLLLTMICIVLRGGERLPDARAALYDRTLSQLLRGEHRLGQKLLNPSAARRLLGQAALRLHGDGGGADSSVIHRIERFLEALPATPGAFRSWSGPENFLDRVAAQTGILERRDRGSEGYLFAHRSFQEFLAAEQFCVLWSSSRPEDQQELSATLHKALESPTEWSEVLALACGRKEADRSCGMSAEQADALVQRLLTEAIPGRSPEELEQKRSELLARVVAEAEGLRTDTVLAALRVDQAGSAWEKRKDKIEKLPTLLGDPEKVLDLLHAWRPHTRNGNDLWFLREELRKLARGEWTGEKGVTVAVELRQQAEVEAGRIFAHLPRAALEQAVAMIRWKPVPKGEFWRGSPEEEAERDDDEGPRHRVQVCSGLEVMDVPVTNGLYECFDPGHRADRGDFTAYGEGIAVQDQDDVPAYHVTWYEAQIFGEWIATHPAHVGSRLPVEAEWEYFCRAGSTTAYHTGETTDDLDRAGWYGDNSGMHPHRVRQKEANDWGLYDCHGNVWEWCLDEFGDYPEDPLILDPRDLRSCPTVSWDNVKNIIVSPVAGRVFRGGSWGDGAQWARSAYRNHWRPGNRFDLLGFRLVRPPQQG